MTADNTNYKAAFILLTTMTDALHERGLLSGELALLHRKLFDEATKDQPEVHIAGVSIAGDIAKYYIDQGN